MYERMLRGTNLTRLSVQGISKIYNNNCLQIKNYILKKSLLWFFFSRFFLKETHQIIRQLLKGSISDKTVEIERFYEIYDC